MLGEKRLTRRSFLKNLAAISSGLVVSGLGAQCQVPVATVPEEVEASKELLFWAWDEPISELMKRGFETKYPDITAKHEIIADYSITLYTSLVAGAGLPDAAWEDAHSYQKLARTGQLLSLDEFLTPYKQEILPFLWDGGLYEGVQYGVPRRYAPEVVYYRKDRFEEVGIDPAEIRTWDDFIVLGQKATDENHHMSVYTSTSGVDYNYQAMIFSKEGTGFFDEQDNVVVNSEKNLACTEKFLELVKSGVVRDMELWQPAWYDAARKGEIACLIMPYWYGSEPRVEMPDNKGQWDIFRIPSLDRGVENASIWQGAMFWVIPKKAKNPDLAWKFIEYTTFDYEDPFMQESMDREFVLPAYTKFLESDYFWPEAEDYFQTNLRQKAHELAQGAPVNYLPPEYTECETILATEILAMLQGEQSPKQTLDNAAEKFEDLLKARV